jgi:single-stranded DNA-binding protein
MVTNLNRVSITGHLARDPTLHDLPSGKSACDVRIACARREGVDYLDARIAGPLARIAHRSLRKDSPVAIEGSLSGQLNYCKHPEHRRELVVLVRTLQFNPDRRE